MSAYIDPKKKGQKFYTAFSEKRVRGVIRNNMIVSSDKVVSDAKLLYTPVGERRPKKNGRPLISTYRRDKIKDGLAISSGNYTDVAKYKGSFHNYYGGRKNGRYAYNGSLVSKNRNKYGWTLRAYKRNQQLVAMSVNPLNKY